MDALELLKQDHQKVKELFEKAEEADGKEQEKIFDQLKPNSIPMHGSKRRFSIRRCRSMKS